MAPDALSPSRRGISDLSSLVKFLSCDQELMCAVVPLHQVPVPYFREGRDISN